jgi:hypothetical protein
MELGNAYRVPALPLPKAGEMPVDLSEDFRKNAATCVAKAREAKTPDARAEWLSMADFWFQLAQQSEGRVDGASDGPIPKVEPSLERGERSD